MITCQDGQCMSTPIAKQRAEMSELLKHVESLTVAYICNGLVAGLKLDPCWLPRCFNPKTCRILLWSSEDLQMPIQASRRYDKMHHLCHLAQRNFNMTLGTRLSRFSKTPGYKMLQDVTRLCETEDLSEVGHLPAMCN